MQNITLSEAWPYIAGFNVVIISVIAFLARRFVSQSDDNFKEIFGRVHNCENCQGIQKALCDERFRTCAKCRKR